MSVFFDPMWATAAPSSQHPQLNTGERSVKKVRLAGCFTGGGTVESAVGVDVDVISTLGTPRGAGGMLESSILLRRCPWCVHVLYHALG